MTVQWYRARKWQALDWKGKADLRHRVFVSRQPPELLKSEAGFPAVLGEELSELSEGWH